MMPQQQLFFEKWSGEWFVSAASWCTLECGLDSRKVLCHLYYSTILFSIILLFIPSPFNLTQRLLLRRWKNVSPYSVLFPPTQHPPKTDDTIADDKLAVDVFSWPREFGFFPKSPTVHQSELNQQVTRINGSVWKSSRRNVWTGQAPNNERSSLSDDC